MRNASNHDEKNPLRPPQSLDAIGRATAVLFAREGADPNGGEIVNA